MQQEWKSFLIQAGAVFEGDRILYFKHSQGKSVAAISNTIITDLSHLGLIAIKGEDAGAFLQNLLTNDIKEVNEQRSQLTGFCNPKGRLLAIFQLFQWNTNFYLSLPHSILESVLKRLNIYILRARVSLTNDSDRFCRFGLAGPQAGDELARLLNRVPSTVNDVYQAPSYCVIRIPDESPRFEVLGEFNIIRKLWDELSKTAAPVGTHLWELLTIRAGIARVYPETQELFIPQQVNLELRGGVSFTKGCYPGQEIIARIHYRGKPSRRMFLAHIAADRQPKPGEPLYLANKEQIGEIVAAEPTPEGGYDSLAVLQITGFEKGEVVLGDKTRSKLVFRKLPYELPI
ncbi:MAG: CAF17-like 4Fe-4S cluster assembly/insertion protein YgfZ [Candidatus Nitrosoglobus sp.]|jgi:folate-binding protein YgfZ